MSVIYHAILHLSYLVWFTRSEYTFKPLKFAATKKSYVSFLGVNVSTLGSLILFLKALN